MEKNTVEYQKEIYIELTLQNLLLISIIILLLNQKLAPAPDAYIPEYDNSNLGYIGKGFAMVGTIGAGYFAYRSIRFGISLLPPLWWTIPINITCP